MIFFKIKLLSGKYFDGDINLKSRHLELNS
ncbi:hypothetical protein AM415_001893 [Acinetobacter baumannii]|jgi:hypothetical protein|nr:hypothetical protein AM415_001893 [Acinetobacter baumannii]